MKNLLIIVLVALSFSLSAQTTKSLGEPQVSLNIMYGGNYAVVDENPLTGITATLQGTVTTMLDPDFGLELTANIGYSSLSNTFKTTQAQIGFGVTSGDLISGGLLVQFQDKNDYVSMGGYAQLNYPVYDNVSVGVRGTLVLNVLEFQNSPTTLNGSVVVTYKF